MDNFPKRKPNRLAHYNYSSPGAYFVTICTKDNKNFFWLPKSKYTNDLTNPIVGATIGRPSNAPLSQIGTVVDTFINQIHIVYPPVNINHYVIMPNHIHLLVEIYADEHGRPMAAPTVSNIISHLKSKVSKKVGFSVWQKLFHDHIIRNRNEYNKIAKYIYNNPMLWEFDRFYSAEI